jgi:hypothetical protein
MSITLVPITGSGYCTAAEVKDAISETGSAYDTQIALALLAAKNAIDGYCKRDFLLYASSARYYTAEIGGTLLIDDTITVSEVAVDENASGTYDQLWAASDYWLYPSNEAIKTSIRTASQGRYSFPVRRKAVRVTAPWGWPVVPDGVHQFAILYSTRLFLRKDVPFGVMAGSEAGTMYIPKNDPDAIMLLGPYVRADSHIGVW